MRVTMADEVLGHEHRGLRLVGRLANAVLIKTGRRMDWGIDLIGRFLIVWIIIQLHRRARAYRRSAPWLRQGFAESDELPVSRRL